MPVHEVDDDELVQEDVQASNTSEELAKAIMKKDTNESQNASSTLINMNASLHIVESSGS